MRVRDGALSLTPTDLSHFLGCRHRIALDMLVAAGTLKKPKIDDPLLEALFARGLAHEQAYVRTLTGAGGSVVDLSDNTIDAGRAVADTLAGMRAGASVIIQAALADGRWYGRPDILKKVTAPSELGAWSYEVEDTKLARETRAGAILQLGLYSEMLEKAQGRRPEYFRIVTPHETHQFRVDDFAAYFRLVSANLDRVAQIEHAAQLLESHYPEPCELCDICQWSARCADRRRHDDHLSLVAGISGLQRRELEARGVTTMTALGEMAIAPLPFKPTRGAVDSYVRVREQARVQVAGRTVFELLDVVKDEGLCRLPEPTPGDIFLDLEGAPFAGPIGSGGREYLFGVVTVDASGAAVYRPRWAETPDDERRAFEALIDEIREARVHWPGMHVYHYAAYEPAALKRLMGRYATREQELDELLRSETLVDLYGVVRQSLRAGIESYSIKNLEPLYAFTRTVHLRHARRHLQAMELALELDQLADLQPEVKAAIAGYNEDDCVSTLRLRDWLETLRQRLIAQGTEMARPASKEGEPTKDLKERLQRVEGLRPKLLAVDNRARYLLAYLLDWHRREEKSSWWEYYRLLELADLDLLDERGAVAGLEFVCEVEKRKRSAVLRFSYPVQEIEIRAGDELKLKDGKRWCEVDAHDRSARTLDLLVGPSRLDARPTSAFAHHHISAAVLEDAIFQIGRSVVDGQGDPLAVALLERRPPPCHDVLAIGPSVLAIQGPPGAGKTYNGGRMICDLVAAGKRVGVTATSHKVIRNLLHAVSKEAAARQMAVSIGHKVGDDADRREDGDAREAILQVSENDEAEYALTSGKIQVLGGTAWLWARPQFAKSVDVLFVDEAGQVSLANTLAVTPATTSLVLLGDPQQLEQPEKGSHPEGVGVSALQHMLGDHPTMPAEQGMFLPHTWRFGRAICDFTSEMFYENKLEPTREIDLEKQALVGGAFDGAGLWVIEVTHSGNRNGSDEEVEEVARIVAQLLARGSSWITCDGETKQMTPADILVVSPYNVQVNRLTERLPDGVEVGTVDRFQGRQAPVVIYSMATSSPEDAPRGMEFLFSLNRLNVATSRARCAAIVVASPRLFEPDCKSPRQMQLANALCRFRELAKPRPRLSSRP